MRKFYFLTILLALLGISQTSWADTAKIEGAEWENSYSWNGNHVLFTFSGSNTSYNDNITGKYLIIAGSTTYSVSWTVDPGYIINVSQIKGKYGRGHVGSIDIYYNDIKCGTVKGWNTNDNVYLGGLSLGNNGNITISATNEANIYWLEITYTITPITYSIAFHADDAIDGQMDNQEFAYDVAQTLTPNAFVHSAYTLNFDADGGECDVISINADFPFIGWATSANGEVVYADEQSVKNLTTENGKVIDLYAKWQESITFPEATKEGFIFGGWYDGDTWIGDAGQTYIPTSDLNLKALWAEKVTSTFSIDKTEIVLGQTAVLTMTNVDNPTVQITPENIVFYNPEDGTLTGISAGEATISITQNETEELGYKHVEFKLNVIKKTPSLAVLVNEEEISELQLFQGQSVNVTFNKVSDAEVQVNVVSGGEFVSYSNGKLIASGNIGTTVFRATLPETDTYKTISKEFSVSVQKDPLHLPMTITKSLWDYDKVKVASEGTVSWDVSKQITLGNVTGGGFNWDDKYVIFHFEGIPDKLTFELATSSDNGTNVEWFVQESATSSVDGAKIWTGTYVGESFSATQTVQLQPTTRYVKLCYSGNFGGYFRNVQISELSYIHDPEPDSIDFGKAVINSGEVARTVNVNWCNIAPMTVTSSNPRFTVSPTTFGNYENYGSQELTISFTHTSETGVQEAEILISNGNDELNRVISVSAETTKRSQTINWNADLAATGFAMNVGENHPDDNIQVVATATSGEAVTFESANSEIIEVINDTLYARAAGTVNITARQAGNSEYDPIEDTQEFTVTLLLKQTITWNQNLLSLLTTDEGVELNAEASSGGEITYESADETIVRVEGKQLIVVGEGETYITAFQAGGEINGEEYLPVSQRNYVIVRDPHSQCNEKALVENELVLSSSNSFSQEYVLEGTPTTMTFSAKHGEKSVGIWIVTQPTYAALLVDQYAKIDNVWGWNNVYNTVVGTDATASGTIALNETATKIRFRTTETETTHTINDIRVERAKFMRADVDAISENGERNAIWQRTITISHSNIDLMTVTTKKGLLNLNVTTLGGGCGTYGDDQFIVSFTPTEKDTEYTDTIVISDGKADESRIEIPVRLITVSFNQSIEDFNLPETCKTTDHVKLTAKASSHLPVVYFSSDSTIAYVENDSLIILAAGTVEITAYQEGDDRFNETSMTKQIVITAVPVIIITAPTASDLIYGQTLAESVLSGGAASTEGTFAWEDPDQAVAVGTNNYSVVFTPIDKLYASVKIDVPVTVAKASQEIEWSSPLFAMSVGDTHELPKYSSVGLEIVYVVDDESVAVVENGNILRAKTLGSTIITATQAGNDYYAAAEPVEKELFVSNAMQTELVALPTATDIYYGQPLSESALIGGEANAEGEFQWEDGDLILNAGTHQQRVIFVPADLQSYLPFDTVVEVTVLQAEQTIIWESGDTIAQMVIGQTLELHAHASSELPITYYSSDEEVVEVEGNLLHALSVGVAIISAEQDGDDNYLPAEALGKWVVVVEEPEFTGIDDVSVRGRLVGVYTVTGQLVGAQPEGYRLSSGVYIFRFEHGAQRVVMQ